MSRLVFSKEKGRLLANDEVRRLDEQRLIDITEERMTTGWVGRAEDFDGSNSRLLRDGDLILQNGEVRVYKDPWLEVYDAVSLADRIVHITEK